MDLVTLIIAGAFTGTVAGLLGIGGGVIIVPVILLVFVGEQVAPNVLIKVAIGTSLATIAVTSLSSIWAHHRRGSVDWALVKIMFPGIIFGAMIGSYFAGIIPGNWLTILFIIFMIGVAFQMAWGSITKSRELPDIWGLRKVATGVGAISALIGIGGGALHVPFFSWCGIPVRRSIATSSALSCPLAFASTLGFIVIGFNQNGLPPYSVGYVNIPAFSGIVVASILFAPLGAKLAHILPELLLKRLFAAFLFILAMRMVFIFIFGN